ncbi:transcriptional regulator [Amycolatopsis sp. cmx-4-54]|uniref:transcriptional regulator n=1 Tax=Amycolatopsis sp. cmx-4-54 TaxID=2790936 RepID=UPI00397BDB79
MLQDYPLPAEAAEFARLIKKRLEEARGSSRARETVTVEWNKQPLHVDVVDLPLSGLYFNPATHRIRAQRSHDPERDKKLDYDPYGDEAQDYLKFLLQAEPSNPERRDPDFDKLKEDLKEFGQTDPGLITSHGILVNGNTRAAALREAGAQSMRVGVLPESFTWSDINAVELSLQLRDDHRREYSYINRLLAMEEQAAWGRTPEEIAKEFRIRVATYEQDRWILSVVRDQIARSKEGSSALRMVDFEDQQEKLKELHRAYKALSSADPDRAEIFKETRMSAIILDFSKTDIRFIEDGGFRDTYLGELPASLETATEEGNAVAVPGLGVTIPGASAAVAAARGLTDQLLKAKARSKASSVSVVSDDERIKAKKVFEEAKSAFEDALDTAGREMRVRKRKQQAPARLADACADIEQCVVELVQARASRTLDEEAFDEAVIRLRDSIKKLAHQAGRGISQPGDGVAWLLDAAGAAEGTS